MKTIDQLKTNYGPVYAAALYPDLASLFHRHGYALAVHGSLARDFDLVGVPWGEIVAEPDGQVLVGGEFWNTNGRERARLARINGTDERRIAIRRDGSGRAVVRINSRSGRRYTVEQASGLETPVWIPTGELTGTGLPVEWVGSGAGGFIRVRAD